jgi:hypothetical protein
MVLHHPDRFEKPYAAFLENTHGKVREREIERADIKTYIEINKGNVSRNIHAISKLVYLRRFYEVTDERGMAYQVISNLLHKRETPIVMDKDGNRLMSDEEKAEGVSEIKQYLPVFDYDDLLAVVQSDTKLIKLYNEATNNYEKLHIYRVIFDDKVQSIESDVIQKFIKEAFHTENDYIYQLDPSKYQTVPQYVIDECDRYISLIK